MRMPMPQTTMLSAPTRAGQNRPMYRAPWCVAVVAGLMLSCGSCERGRSPAPQVQEPGEREAAPTPPAANPTRPPGNHPDERLEHERNNIRVFRQAAPSAVFVTQKQLVRDMWTMRTAE